MPQYQVYMLVAKIMWGVFIFAFGACCGSLINVLVYRLPMGLSVVTPPSRCPSCDTRLTWRENIPVFGWLLLRGRCRFCKSRISAEYPIVEAFTGLLFIGVFVLWYLTPDRFVWLDVPWGLAKPEWARNDLWDAWPRQTWPEFIVVLMLLGSLVAMTIVDAKTFTIPLQIPWFATAVALIFHTGHGVWRTYAPGWGGSHVMGSGPFRIAAPGAIWSIPTPGWPHTADGSNPWWWIGASIGGVIGLIVANAMMHFGLIRRSFADYDEWERTTHAGAAPRAPSASDNTPILQSGTVASPTIGEVPPGAIGLATIVLVLSAAGLTAIGGWIGPALGAPAWIGLVAAIIVSPIAAGLVAHRKASAANRTSVISTTLVADGITPTSPPTPASPSQPAPPDMWIQYPHARREMIKELAFLSPCVCLGWLGAWLFGETAATPPLWLLVLGGVLMGYLIGGGIVWAVRIGGSLAFGKEAMGLGDVHLMAAVGACIGWVDAALAFPLAAVVGLYWVVVSRVVSGSMARAMPFGPYLAGATVIVLLGKPLVELGLTALLSAGSGSPPINLP